MNKIIGEIIFYTNDSGAVDRMVMSQFGVTSEAKEVL